MVTLVERVFCLATFCISDMSMWTELLGKSLQRMYSNHNLDPKQSCAWNICLILDDQKEINANNYSSNKIQLTEITVFWPFRSALEKIWCDKIQISRKKKNRIGAAFLNVAMEQYNCNGSALGPLHELCAVCSSTRMWSCVSKPLMLKAVRTPLKSEQRPAERLPTTISTWIAELLHRK